MPAPTSKARRKPPVERDSTERVVGLEAVRAVLRQRPEAVLHLAHSSEARRQVADLLREAARLRIAYREVPEDELGRIAGTLHHEGVCLQVKPRLPVALNELTRRLAQGGFALALDGVQNPHNVGALLRSAAYFGAAGMLLGGPADKGLLGPAAVRVAEGGAEYVPVCSVAELGGALDTLHASGVGIVGADAHTGEPLAGARLPARCLIVLGSERSGLSPAVLKRCSQRVRIEGAGQIESLNVSVAAGILLAHAAEQARGVRAGETRGSTSHDTRTSAGTRTTQRGAR
jgi:RNA methyltransferase, TrmH family